MEVEPIVDHRALSEQVEGDAALLKDLTDTFCQEAERRLEALECAVEHRDSEAVHRHAHSLKGALSYLHAPRAYAAALALEECGERGELTPARAAFSRLESEVADLIAVLPTLKAVDP